MTVSLLEVPEDPPRQANALARRVSALLVDTTKCVGDPRALVNDVAAERELDFLVDQGILEVLDRPVIEAAALEQASASRSFAPGVETLDRFTGLVTRLGAVKIEGANQIIMPGHDFVSDSRWFPAAHFRFERPFTKERVAQATREGGPTRVVRLMAETMYERTAAQLATLQTIALREDADLVSSTPVASLLSAIEDATRGGVGAPLYLGAGTDVLVGAILRHARAVQGLEQLSIEEVVDLARRLAEPRARFQKLVQGYADQVMDAPDPTRSADRIYRKHVAPELAAYEKSFGDIFRTMKTYAADAVFTQTVFTLVPLALLGMVAGVNTAWTLAASTAHSAWKTGDKRKAWPRLLLELRLAGRRGVEPGPGSTREQSTTENIK